MTKDEVMGTLLAARNHINGDSWSEVQQSTLVRIEKAILWLEDKNNSTMYEICESGFEVEGWLLSK